jgi:hypothetical protein
LQLRFPCGSWGSKPKKATCFANISGTEIGIEKVSRAFCSHERELSGTPPLVPNGGEISSSKCPKKEIISDAILWTPLFTVFFDLSRVGARDPPFLIYEGKTEVGQYSHYTGASRLPTSIRFGEHFLRNVQ